MKEQDEKKDNSKITLELADEEPTRPVNPTFFAMQIVITVILVIIQSIIQFYVLGITEVPFTVSAWLLGLSVAYFFYRDNEYLYSLILAGFMAMVFVIGSNMATGTLVDLQHVPTLIAAMHIITQKREFDFNVIVYGTIFIFCYVWTIWAVGVAYQYFSLNFMIALSFIIFMNLSFFYALKKKPGKHEEKEKIKFPGSSTIQVVIVLGITLVLIFLLAGDVLTYWQGWVYTTISIMTVLIATGVFLRKEIDVEKIIDDHVKLQPDMTRLDKALFFGYIPLYFLVIILASLDGGRFQWTTEIPILAYFFGCVGLGFSSFLKRWALISHNDYRGPYRIIRHPGYLSGIIGVLSTAIVLGSLWALIPAGVAVFILFIQAYRDDKALEKKSLMYAHYMTKVKYRLIPGVF
jgi:protein-S-isoprenylcysteine O-methyltransferase Ste14